MLTMKNIFSLLFSYIKLYKWFLLVFVSFLFFLLLVIFSFRSDSPNPSPLIQPTPFEASIAPSQAIPTIQVGELDSQHEPEENPESDPTFLRKTTRSDGMVELFFSSSNPSRPSMTITTSQGEPTFQRTVFSPDETVLVSTYQKDPATADQILRSSRFYGPEATVYIYCSCACL